MCEDCLTSLRSFPYPSKLRSLAARVLERDNHFHYFYDDAWLRNTDDLPTPVSGVPIL